MNERAGSVPPVYRMGSAASRTRPAAKSRARQSPARASLPDVAQVMAPSQSPSAVSPSSGSHDAEPAAGPQREPGAASPDGLVPQESAPSTLPAGLPQAEKQPSWPRVIATTLQLWLQRRVLGGPEARTGRPAVARRMAIAFGIAVVVFAAGALTISLALGHGTTRAAHGARAAAKPHQGAGSPGGGALQQAAKNRATASAWVAAEVGHGTIVSCDPVMCAALQHAGFPAGNLLTLGPDATDPMGSQLVVATTALRSQLGRHLASVYAPVVIASFGTGASRVDIRVEAPDGSSAYLLDQRADLLARRESGQQLLHNKNLHVTGTARQAVAAGNVDPRLLITLAALATQHNVYVYRFGDQGPGAAAAVPMRMVRLAALVPRAHPRKNSYLQSLVSFLRAQQVPFRPIVTVVRNPGHTTAIQIQFPAPSPLGLLGGAKGTP
jgi:hypothetical protein